MILNKYKNEVIWIIGASSGIGLSLARELAARGAVLALTSRRKEELDSLQVELGGAHSVFSLDVTDADTVNRTAQAIRAAFGRIDRIIFLAAAYAPMKLDSLDQVVTRQIIETNVGGAFNIVHAALVVFKTQKIKGQIALCGSVAGYIGLPGGQPYSATKSAVINLAESLYAECRDICDVKLINPGFVRTPLTAKNKFKMPMMVEPEQAAVHIAEGLLARAFEIHFPRKFTLFLKFIQHLPYAVSLWLMRKIKI